MESEDSKESGMGTRSKSRAMSSDKDKPGSGESSPLIPRITTRSVTSNIVAGSSGKQLDVRSSSKSPTLSLADDVIDKLLKTTPKKVGKKPSRKTSDISRVLRQCETLAMRNSPLLPGQYQNI